MSITLTASRIRLTRSRKTIVDIDHLSISAGGVLALIGPNGAGKSTLLQILSLLLLPDSGTIEWNGEPVTEGNRLAAIRRMAIVFQDALLLNTTVKRNIEIPQRIRGIPKKDAEMRAEEWMNRLGIAHLARHPARKLSGGEAQRTSIARALALQPQLLFMDEPFSALDYPTRKSLLVRLGDILPASGITTMFVTHDFSEIPYLTNQVAVLFEGRIVQRGNIRDILGESAVSIHTWAPWERIGLP
uniref:ATP-binding cassette domain-containing protein n=1 Tax=Desulfatirhabdium butyrativorans TaxID=340467 RepID=A0A7C4RTM6_9BACT